MIVDYDPRWPEAFSEIQGIIATALGALALAVEHVGSTAVPGLPAKPIRDIDVVIESQDHLPQVVTALAGLGYRHQGDLGIAGREAFACQGADVPRDGTGRSWPVHHLYVCPKDSPEVGRHLAFRNHLRAKPEIARAYGELKQQLARQCAENRDAYWRGKTSFIEATLRDDPSFLPLDFTLLTPRCRLRCVSEVDIPHVWSATRYQGFNDGMTWDAPTTMEELQAPLRRNLAAWAAGREYTFTIESKADSTFLGRIVIRKSDEEGVWNLGFWTHPEYQNQGYMTEAARALVTLGFERLGADRIEACHALWNTPSQRVMEKLGMRFLRLVPQGYRKKGQWVPENLLAIERSAWKS